MEFDMDTTDSSRAGAYKVGFLIKLAECGIPPSAFHARLKKAFFDPSMMFNPFAQGIGDIGKTLTGMPGEAAKSLAGLGAQAAVVAPLAAGGLSGIAEAALDAPSPEDIENLRRAELIATYERLTREINARRARKAAMQ